MIGMRSFCSYFSFLSRILWELASLHLNRSFYDYPEMGTNKSLQLGLAGVVRDVQGVSFGKFHKYDVHQQFIFRKHTVFGCIS